MRTLRGDRAATDPILVIAAIAVSLILLVGGSFAVAGMIANGRDLNARADLDKVSTAENALATSGKSLGNPAPTVLLKGTLPDPSGAANVNPASVNVNYGGIGYTGVTLSSSGSTWNLTSSAYINGSWTPSSTNGTHAWSGSSLTPSTEVNPDSGITYDLSGITKAAGTGSVTMTVVLPTASTGFAPYLSTGSGNISADLTSGGSTPARALEQADVGFTPTDGGNVAVSVTSDGAGWAAVSKSQTGSLFIRTSTSSKVGALSGSTGARTLPADVTLPAGMTPAALNTALTNAGGF